MEQSLGQDSVPGFGSFDKSRVLDVRPLRRLVPVFPSASSSSSFSTPQGAAPFVCASPAGPFPPGVSPFFPFYISAESQRPPEQNQQTPSGIGNQNTPFVFNNPISNAVPINSFRTPPSSTARVTPNQYTGTSNGDTTPSRRITRSRAQPQSQSGIAEEDGFNTSVTDGENTRKGGRSKSKFQSQKRTRGGQDINVALPDVDVDAIVDNILTSYTDTFRHADGNKESVGYALVFYDLLRRRITQLEEMKEKIPGASRTGRPDLRAGTLFMNKGIRTNTKRRIGAVPGVEVGDIFFFRMELCLVGLHAPTMGGIDYMGVKNSAEDEPLALSIVSSGGYEDSVEDANVLIYSGQGGNASNDNRNNREMKDQKLERGNLALEKSLHRSNDVRVIRGIKDVSNPTGKVYVYDGLYKIHESWVDKGKSGCSVFKYKLVRLPGQPEAFTIWKSIEQWKVETTTTRVGLILPDLTSGAENLPVSLVNDVDGEKGPAHFTMATNLFKCSTGIGVRLLFPFAHSELPLNFHQINSAINGNYHHLGLRNKKPKLPSARSLLWHSSSSFCTAASATDASATGASGAVSDASIDEAVPPVSDVEDQKQRIKDAADVLDIRVGRVLKAWRHEEADSLYVEEVDIGEPEPRTICSGLVKYVPLDHLQDRNVVVLANLKPRNMRGVKSSGMLLAASDASHENVELLVPPEGSLPGQRVWFGSEDDHQNQPPPATANQIQKKKIWELVQPHLKTDDSCIAILGGHVMQTSAGVVISSSLKNANIS